jgi:hypothetical protein
MSITFNQLLSRIDEANISGSRPRPQGRDVLTPAERARVSTRRDRSPIQKTGGGVSYVTVAPETEQTPKPQKQVSSTPKQYVQKWIPEFPAPKDLKVKPHKKPKLKKPEKSSKLPKPTTRQLSLRLKEFIDYYRQSVVNS